MARDHVPYDLRHSQVFLETTEGNVVHNANIEQLGTRFDIREIAFDRWGAVQMSQNLQDMGFTVVPFGQGFKDMSPPSKELMKLTFEGRFAHGATRCSAGWSTTFTCNKTRQETSNPTSKSSPRRSTGSSPPSWPSTAPSEAAAAIRARRCTTNAAYSFSSPPGAGAWLAFF